MKKILGIVVLGLLWCSVVVSEIYKTGQEVEGQIVFSKKVKIDLPEGKWTLASRALWNWHGLNLTDYTLIKLKDNEISEGIFIGEFELGGIATGQIDPILNELVFKGEHDGCYERPEYFLIKFYSKGNTHNCFTVRHVDLIQEIDYPDDPEMRGANLVFSNWIKDNSIKVPKISLLSEHTYFSRLVGGNWYQVQHFINPKFLDAPKNKFYTEESSEYHKYNIEQFPDHKKIMQKWLTISAERHKIFEQNIMAKDRHKLDLSNYYSGKIKSKDNKSKLSSEVITQIEQLNDLYKAGVLTKEEFTKAKKKILN